MISLEQAYSEQNINILRQGVESGEVDPSTLPAHVQYELSARNAEVAPVTEYTQPTSYSEYMNRPPSEQTSHGSESHTLYAQIATTIASRYDADQQAVLDAFNNFSNASYPKGIAEEKGRELLRQRVATLTEAAADMLRAAPVESYGDIIDGFERTRASQLADIDSRYAVFKAEALAASDGSVDERQIDLEAVDRKAFADLAELYDSTPTWRKVKDFAFSFSDFHFLDEVSTIVGAGSAFSAEEAIKNAIIAFRSETDPVRKAEMWEGLFAWAQEELNSTQTVDLLSKFLDEGGAYDTGQYASGWVGLSTVGPLALFGWLGAKVTRGVGNSVRVAARVRKMENAAKEAVAAAQSDEAAKAAGTTKVDLANDVTPVDTPMSGGKLDGMAAPYQEEVQKFAEGINKTVRELKTGEHTIQVSPYNANELAEVNGSINKQLWHIIQRTRGDVESAVVTRISDDSVQLVMEIKPHVTAGRLSANNSELTKAGERLLALQDEGMVSSGQVSSFVKAAQERGSSADSINDAIDLLAEGYTVPEAVALLDVPAATTITRTVTAKFDDTVGAFAQTRQSLGDWFLSNRAAARTPDVVENVEKALVLDNVSAKISYDLKKQVRSIFDDIPARKGFRGKNKARIAVQRALIDGDEWVDPETGIEVGRVWTARELRDQFGLSDGEAAAYFKLRTVYDNLHVLKDFSLRQELVRLGYQDIKLARPIRFINDEGVEESLDIHDIGKVFMERSEAAGAAQNPAYNVQRVFDSTTQQSVAYSQDMLAEAYNNGKVLVRLRDPVSIPGRGRVQHMLVDYATEVRDLPSSVLNYKTGYVPRVYDRGAYFVKQLGYGAAVDGNALRGGETIHKTFGMADNERAAAALRDKLMRESADENIKYEVVVSDQLDAEQLLLEEARGSLYTSPRGNPVPQYKLDRSGNLIEEKASRIDAYQALSAGINNIAFHMPRTEWRMAQLERLRKSAAQLGVQWNGLHQPATGGTPDQLRFIERQRQNMRDWMALPDSFTESWDTAMQHLYETALDMRIGSKAILTSDSIPAKGIWWLKSHDPVTAARAATFHMMLGLFNPVQLFVQGNGFSVAAGHAMFSNNITEVADVFRAQLALRHIDFSDNPDTVRRMVENLAKDGLVGDMSVDSVVAMHNAWRRSGLREGVFSSGDFENIESGFGNIWSATSDFAHGPGMWFYRTGETFNRRFSFATAWRRVLADNPDWDVNNLTDAQLTRIVSRANDYMLNLGRSNRAAWQKGVLSIPTQFWQVQAKLIEQYVQHGAGRVLTPQEKMKVLGGQIGLYGMTGVPIAGGAAKYYASQSEWGAEDDSSVLRRTFDEGAWGMIFGLLGADVEVANRGSILGDMQNLVYDWMFGEKDMSRLLSGAFGNIGIRGFEGMQRLSSLSLAAFSDSPPATVNDWAIAIDALGDLSTTWSNATKAYVMATQGQLYSRSGILVAEDQWNLTTLVGSAIGFQPTSESNVYDLRRLNSMYQSYRQDAARAVRRAMLDRYQAYHMTGQWREEDNQRLEATVRALVSRIRPEDQEGFLQDIHQELLQGRSLFAQESRKFINAQLNGDIDAALSFFEKSVVGGVEVDKGAY